MAESALAGKTHALRGAFGRLRILTWNVHGNWLYYFSHVPHDLFVVTRPGNPAGYARLGDGLPWGNHVHEIAEADVGDMHFDLVLYQSAVHFREDRQKLAGGQIRDLPSIYVEHDPPCGHPTDSRHPVAGEEAVLLIHVTHFNALMWDGEHSEDPGRCRVIEHGVCIPAEVGYRGGIVSGVTAINHLQQRGRRLGADVYAQLAREVPLTLAGMASEMMGGVGEIRQHDLPEFLADYRFFFYPVRYTSLGLAVIEAMMAGLPVVGLATTELVSVISNEVNGHLSTDPEALIEPMHALLADHAKARRMGEAGREYASRRFAISRFVHDWEQAFARVLER